MTPAPVATAALPLPLDSTNPKELYETAYGYLLQRDYGAAQAAFDDFLAKYPKQLAFRERTVLARRDCISFVVNTRQRPAPS